MKKKSLFILLSMTMWTTLGHAQQDDKLQSMFDSWRREIHSGFNDFRRQCLEDYIDFLRNPWKEFESEKPVPKPKEEPTPPVVMPDEEKDKPLDPKPVVIEEIVKPTPVPPQPKPIEPIEEVPVKKEAKHHFTFFGTAAEVRFDTANKIQLRGISADDIADGLEALSEEAYDNMIVDCLAIRQAHELCDWAYLLMIKALAESLYGTSTNEAALLTGYIYMQSGYKMRYGIGEGRLYALFATPHMIYEHDTFLVEGTRYCGLEDLPSRLQISDAVFPKEQSMSLYINKEQVFSEKMSQPRTITSKRYPDASITVSVNENLMDFYSTYPTSIVDDNVMTRWAMYAVTPMQEKVKEQVYPSLRTAIEGCNQMDAANRLLNFVQTGLVYEYDDEVWGDDRTFFAEESLFYPYCDCEDRAVLFTRLVRDMMGLDCILIYYPGHLACAVCFTEEVEGDYIMLNDKKFIVSDPTYIGAPVGKTMPDMDNQSAKVILLH